MSNIEQVFIKEEVFLEEDDDEEEEDEEDEDVIPCESDVLAENGKDSVTVPKHSKTLYWNAYKYFKEWMTTRRVEGVSEEIVLYYFEELSKKYKPPSLWTKYSMLRSTIKVKHNIDIHDYTKLIDYLKEENKDYVPKQSEVLTINNVKTFLTDAPDYEYLATKVALIIALFGGCRLCDLIKLANKDVEQHGEIMKVTLRNRRNNTIKTFIIEGEMLQPILNFRSLRPRNATHERFFLSYKNGRCINLPLGKNKFGTMPKEIAHFLNLPNPELFTGHSFRRSSATLCKDQGISLSDLRRLVGSQLSKPKTHKSNELKRKASNEVEKEKFIPGPSQQSRILIVEPKIKKLTEAPPKLKSDTHIYVSTLPVINDKIILYSYWRSSCSYRVRIALNLKEIPYDIKPINLEKGGGEQHSDEFRKINPMARVPALHIDNHTLIESLNILQYLEETRPSRPLMPADPVKRARIRELCEVVASGIQPLQNVGVLSHLTEQQKKEWPQFWITRGLMAVEELLSSCAGKYSFGDEITLADCCLVPQIYNARKFKIDVKRFSKIMEIDKNLEKHPAFVAAHPNNQPDCPFKVNK